MSGYAVKLSAGVLLALTVTAGPAAAIALPDPPVVLPSMVEPGPPNYPSYDPEIEAKLFPPPAQQVEQRKSGLDTTSVALGALGGIALGGAALGITLVVERRRHHAPLHTA
jgi:hypothetical protein